MQSINFFLDPGETPRAREDVRLKQLGLFVYEDGRRIAIGFDITPFRERPSIEVTATNERGEPAGSLTVIDAFETNFHLTMHLRDAQPTQHYEVEAVLYYDDEAAGGRMDVHSRRGVVDVTVPGETTVGEEE